MQIAIKARHRKFIENKVRAGKFESAGELVDFALDRLRRDDDDLQALKRSLQESAESMDRGEEFEWNVAEAKARLLRRLRTRSLRK